MSFTIQYIPPFYVIKTKNALILYSMHIIIKNSKSLIPQHFDLTLFISS